MLLKLENIYYEYSYGTYKVNALKKVNLNVNKGDFIGIMGKTGSGKSTILQILNGILYPNKGRVLYNNEEISKKNIINLRNKVGLLFQFPEHQLFAETVEKDVAFGLVNRSFKKKDIKNHVRNAMNLVGLSYEEYKDRSPFSLSGGEQRKAALAGILAFKPEILVLDEPTVGLDPKERNNLNHLLKKIHTENKTTIIIATHSLQYLLDLVTRLLVMKDGKIILDAELEEAMKKSNLLKDAGIELPLGQKILKILKEKDVKVRDNLYKPGDVEEEIIYWARRKGICLKD